MPTLHTWNTPNGQKPAILLEELGLDYVIEPVDLRAGAQKAPGHLALNPNGKIPALTDDDGTVVWESGAILIHLAETRGAFLAPSGQARADALAWSFWQVGGPAPMVGQYGHFLRAEPRNDAAVERYLEESLRLFGVLERRLAEVPWLAGDAYSIADMMVYPLLKAALSFMAEPAGDRLPALAATRAWLDRISLRPQVQRGLERVKAAVT